MSDRELRLRAVADSLRGVHRLDDMAAVARERGHTPVEVLEALSWSGRTGYAAESCPPLIIETALTILSGRPVQSMLDCWYGLGGFLVPLAQRLMVPRGLGVHPMPAPIWDAFVLESHEPLELQRGDPIVALQQTEEVFDVVIGNLPWNARQVVIAHPSGDVHDELGLCVLFGAAQRMAPHGVGLFLLANSAYSRRKPRGVFSRFATAGLRLDAFLELPPGTFASTAVRGVLAVVSRGSQGAVFIGSLGPDSERNGLLLENLRLRRDAGHLAEGRLVQAEEFESVDDIRRQESLARLSQHAGLSPMPARHVVKAVNMAKDRVRFEEIANSVYLPAIGTSHAVASIADLQIKAQNYLQLVIDEEVADARYVAGFLNSPIGKAVREIAMTGYVIPRITKTTADTLVFFLPELEMQRQSVALDIRAHDAMIQLRDTRERIWSHPRKLDKTAAALDRLVREDRIQDWIDNLPFPLASVLWAYHASKGRPKEQYEHVDHFFEALAQFMATTLLSAVRRDRELYAEELAKVRTELASAHLTLGRASMGTWVCIYEKLSKRVKALVNGKQDDKDRAKSLFATLDTEVISALVHAKVVSAIRQANTLRNGWRGHGGVVGEQVAQERVLKYQSLLSEVREAFSDVWSRYRLVSPESMRLVGGKFLSSIRYVMGSRTPFETGEAPLRDGMEDGQLYLLDNASDDAVLLLPLVKVLSSPPSAHNACYFFNRRESRGMRYVSYHFESQAELVGAFDDASKTLSELAGPEEAP